jgi:hypothetical protein
MKIYQGCGSWIRIEPGFGFYHQGCQLEIEDNSDPDIPGSAVTTLSKKEALRLQEQLRLFIQECRG